MRRQVLAGGEWRDLFLGGFSLGPVFWDPHQREQKSSLTSENKISLSGFFSSFFPLAFASVQLACELILPSLLVETSLSSFV